ncbi:unnamed protein product [Angiostrongylus costaricensis]|uniref:Uncharacterized protein n=1 Tax=Angiostrongylus costaricensis TaxID=334426 RepID=A0A0R3PH41_ANGCS|nr:unnamed protein product [Angiostrongylus costaricensis]
MEWDKYRMQYEGLWAASSHYGCLEEEKKGEAKGEHVNSYQRYIYLNSIAKLQTFQTRPVMRTCILVLTVGFAAAFDSTETQILYDDYAPDKLSQLQPLLREGRSFDSNAGPLIRFGKRDPYSAPFIRFGRAPLAQPLIRFGKRSPHSAPLIRYVC